MVRDLRIGGSMKSTANAGRRVQERAICNTGRGSPAQLSRDTVQALTSAVAQELHRRYGGNEVLDWLEAEIIVQKVVEHVKQQHLASGQ